jgi:AraC-like DNA-binding protein
VPRTYYQQLTRFIPARHQAALLLEFAHNRELGSDTLLRGTRLFESDVLAPDTYISPAEYLQLLANLQHTLAMPDTSFVLGELLLPGHFGNLSHALLQAGSLRQALEILIAWQSCLSPLLAPHLTLHGDNAVLYWTDSCAMPAQRAFVVEMMMAAVTGMSRWLGGERLPWSFRFNRTRPAHIEQYAVHLGTELRFNDYMDAMSLPAAWLDRPWPRGSAMAVSAALAAVPQSECSHSLLAGLYDFLLEHVRLAPTLEQASAEFGVSPATFKRHLAAHGTHFQAELDQVRAHATLQLIHTHGYANDQIAAWLGFHDANNFRRSLKRWTGLTPSMLRAHLLDTGS